MVAGVMDVAMVVTISILAAVFFAALIALVVLLKRRYCKPMDLISAQYIDSAPDADLVGHMEGLSENPSGVELDEVCFNPNLDQMFKNETWATDAAGLVPHCLAILKVTHQLTEKLVSVTLSDAHQLQFPETLTDLVAVARRIGSRVDDVVRSMYPPLDPRLLEARCSALVLSVNHLVMLAKTSCGLSRMLDWVDQSLADVEDHLKVLKEASIAYEANLQSAAAAAAAVVSGSHPAASNDPWEAIFEEDGSRERLADRSVDCCPSSVRESSQV